MANHATSRNRNRRQKLKRQYARFREEAQLHGIIPISPEGAMRREVVDPATQEKQEFPALDRKAVNEDWDVPGWMKPRVVDGLYSALERAVDEGKCKAAVMNSNTLLKIDQMQYERDHPKEAGQGKGVASVSVIQQVDIADLLRRAEAQRYIKHELSLASVAPSVGNQEPGDGQ